MQYMHKQFYTLQEFKMKAFSYSFTLLSGQFKKHINLKIVQCLLALAPYKEI